MKIRYVLVAIVVTLAAACSSSPTSPDDLRSASDLTVLRDGTPTDTTAASRGSGWAGSGS